MAAHRSALGVDFGTSNSAAGYLVDGRPKLVEMTPGRTSLPTTFFFDFETRRTLIGEPANRALLSSGTGTGRSDMARVSAVGLAGDDRLRSYDIT